MPTIPKIISVDDHVVEPPDLWTARLPSKYRDRCPRVERDTAVFNFEGGCYAKAINLSQEAEPEIYSASLRFGTVLENVTLDPHTKFPNFDDDSLTENTRSSYPLDYIPGTSETGIGGQPENIVMLTADAFGVLPPISQLTAVS